MGSPRYVVPSIKNSKHRKVASALVSRHGRELWRVLVNEHTGATVALGNLLLVLVLLGLWQRSDFERVMKYEL